MSLTNSKNMVKWKCEGGDMRRKPERLSEGSHCGGGLNLGLVNDRSKNNRGNEKASMEKIP